MENKSTIKKYTFSLFFLVSFLSFTAFAQENGIYELKSESNSTTFNKTSSKGFSVTKSSKSSIDSRSEFNNLAYKLHTTVYVENSIVKAKYGDGDVIKIILEDINSIETLSSLIAKYPKTKILIIKLNSINDLTKSYNLSTMLKSNNLRYLLIQGNFPCNESNMNNFIKTPQSIRVFYSCAYSD
ncbi:hypothetical protein BWZ22_14005 [Seonamhaeicola sp. S2-3]|uniref:hypothetical protein n=1 Tax=Seonamhaeicola sp. S2-3 TaxID=1936081 RepID=UPI000972E2A9|nr:hypothetical protein [Seonamhaeicola sp. S2-3]APY12267.1 hypothetical protein BWZ22_14005 [Seonamhaeicola sp. S2-3]